MLSTPQSFLEFQMIVIHPSMDIYSVFRFEPVHNVSFGLSQLKKECTKKMQRDK